MGVTRCPHGIVLEAYCHSCVDDRIKELADMQERTFELAAKLLLICHSAPEWAKLAAHQRHQITAAVQTIALTLRPAEKI